MTLIKVAGAEFDLAAIKPLTLRDWKVLREAGIDLFRMTNNLNETMLAGVVGHALRKLNPDVTDDDVLDLAITTVNKIAGVALGGNEDINRPT